MPFEKGTDNRTARILLRVTEAEKAAFHAQASEAGLKLSEYIRRRLTGHRVHSIASQQTINELRRLGGLLKKVHTDSRGAYSEATAEALREVVAAVKRIGG